MSEQFANEAASTLSSAIDNSTTSIPVADGSVFPASGDFAFRIDAEIFKATSRSGNTITCAARPQEGTSAAAHAIGAAVVQVLTKRSLDLLQQKAALLDGDNHTDTVAQTVSRGSLVYGNSTPKWDELPIGSASKFLVSDGTDIAWVTMSQDATLLYDGGITVKALRETGGTHMVVQAITDGTVLKRSGATLVGVYAAPAQATSFGGRLTLTSGTSVTTADVLAATTLYYALHYGSVLPLVDDVTGLWIPVTFTEKSIKLTDSSQTGDVTINNLTILNVTDTSQLSIGMIASGAGIVVGSVITSVSATSIGIDQLPTSTGAGRALTFKLPTGKNYDVFGVASTSVLKLILSNAWTNDTTRADALGVQDGVIVNNANISLIGMIPIVAKKGVYLGTFRTTGTAGQTEDSYGGAHQAGGHRYVWNMYNRVPRTIGVIDTTNSWNYTTATWRIVQAVASNRVEFVIGLASWVEAIVGIFVAASAVSVSAGIGIDVTNANSAQIVGIRVTGFVNAIYKGEQAAGYHNFNWLEISTASGTTTWFGDNNLSYHQAGMMATINA